MHTLKTKKCVHNYILLRSWFDKIHILHIIRRSVTDTQTQTVVVCVGRLFLQKDGANNVWLKYRDTNIVYRVPYRAVCIAIRVAGCTVPALVGGNGGYGGYSNTRTGQETAEPFIFEDDSRFRRVPLFSFRFRWSNVAKTFGAVLGSLDAATTYGINSACGVGLLM